MGSAAAANEASKRSRCAANCRARTAAERRFRAQHECEAAIVIAGWVLSAVMKRLGLRSFGRR